MPQATALRRDCAPSAEVRICGGSGDLWEAGMRIRRWGALCVGAMGVLWMLLHPVLWSLLSEFLPPERQSSAFARASYPARFFAFLVVCAASGAALAGALVAPRLGLGDSLSGWLESLAYLFLATFIAPAAAAVGVIMVGTAAAVTPAWPPPIFLFYGLLFGPVVVGAELFTLPGFATWLALALVVHLAMRLVRR